MNASRPAAEARPEVSRTCLVERLPVEELVGVRGFEPPAPTSPNVVLYQAELHSDDLFVNSIQTNILDVHVATLSSRTNPRLGIHAKPQTPRGAVLRVAFGDRCLPSGPYVPNVVLYQAELHSDIGLYQNPQTWPKGNEGR